MCPRPSSQARLQSHDHQCRKISQDMFSASNNTDEGPSSQARLQSHDHQCRKISQDMFSASNNTDEG
ncbi:hypothetical protein J6590_107269 [Homalodisca vitripennis]|nr:hypothetical protein J6590_107269 [Homalodisca vitripennis]